MIDRGTLARMAGLQGIKPWQQEKHYIQSAILVSLSEEPLVMKGGTYLWLFHGLDRFSEDLDFTCEGEIAEGIMQKTSDALAMLGIENSVKAITDDERSFSFRVSAKGPLNTSAIDLCHVYVEISRRERVLKPTLGLRMEFDAYSLPVKIIGGMSLDEVAAEKVRALLTRKKARDAYDLFFLISKKKAAFDRSMVEEKLEYYGIGFSESAFLEKLGEKEKIWDAELKPMVFGELPPFAKASEAIRKWVGIR